MFKTNQLETVLNLLTLCNRTEPGLQHPIKGQVIGSMGVIRFLRGTVISISQSHPNLCHITRALSPFSGECLPQK